MYPIGRDNVDSYDFRSEENLKHWRGFFIPALQQIQKQKHETLIAKTDALQYVESCILKLLASIISTNGPVSPIGSSMIRTISDVEDRIRRLIPDALGDDCIKKAKEILSQLRNCKKRFNSRFHSSERGTLKTPIDKFHQLLQKSLGYKTDIQVSQYLLAVLEYIAMDILQLAGRYVGNIIQTEITAQDIRVTMYSDKSLTKIFFKDDDEDDYSSFFDMEFDNEFGNVGSNSLTYSEAVREFIQEEKQFIRELCLIIKVFREPLTTILDEDDLNKIFVNIDEIYEFSNKFLGLLEDALEVADEDDCPAIGSCFIEIAEDEEMDVFHKYTQNVMNLSYRDNVKSILSQPSLVVQIKELFIRYSANMLPALQYVLPRLLLLPVYHCFSYFKTIEKLKDLTPSKSDKENLSQAESTLQSLRNILESEKKSSKYLEGPLLRLYKRTHRGTAMAKMKEIHDSFEKYDGKDIRRSCNAFIREGILYKINKSKPTPTKTNERRAFLFDSLFLLCKATNNCQLRVKEKFYIGEIEIIERDDCYVKSTFPEPALSLLSSSVSNISRTTNFLNDSNTLHAFELTQADHGSIKLCAKTAEEKDSWISQLTLLSMRPTLERALDSKLSEEAKKHPLALPHPSIYRFSIEDNEFNIMLEENKSNPNVPLIKGATLLKLVERLTYHKYGDPSYVKVFLTTYRTFCTPCEFLKLLIERFEIPEPDFRSCMQAMHYANEELSSPTSMAPPQQETNTNDIEHQSDSLSNTGPTSPTSLTSISSCCNNVLQNTDLNIFDEENEQCQQDYKEMLKRFRKEYAQPVQFRVLNVLRHWIDKHYYDFERDYQLKEMLNKFLNEKLYKTHTKWYHNIRNVIDRSEKQKLINFQIDLLQPTTPISNVPIYEKFFSKNQYDELDLFAFSPDAIAKEMTLFEFELYRAVQPYELVGMEEQSLVWTKKDKQKTSPNLLKMMRHYSAMVYYFEKCIVEVENFEERVAIKTRIVEIMIKLMDYNNFNGVFEINAAFNSSSVHRLEHTKAYLERNSKLKKAMEEAKELTDEHFKKYKEKLFSINPPCVPFLGCFLTNIVHLEEGNPDHISPPNLENLSLHETNNNNNNQMLLDDNISNKLINFQKKRRVAETISLIQQYQNTPYKLDKSNPTIKNFFESLVFPESDKALTEKIEDHLYKKSLEIEPRNCRAPPKFPRRWPELNLKQLTKSRNIRLLSIPGISHQSSTSTINSHNDSNINLHSNYDMDSISLQQQQSPSTPTTTSPNMIIGSGLLNNNNMINDSIFANVFIGTNNNNSPTTPSLHATSMSFFPTSQPIVPISPASANTLIYHYHSASSPTISTTGSIINSNNNINNNINSINNNNNNHHHHHHNAVPVDSPPLPPPPLPPRGTRDEAPVIPPRTHRPAPPPPPPPPSIVASKKFGSMRGHVTAS